MGIAKRYGFKKRANWAVGEIGDVIRNYRATVTSEAEDGRHPPAASGDVNPNARPTVRVSGSGKRFAIDPPELPNLEYAVDEDELRQAIRGAPTPCGGTLPQGDVKIWGWLR